MKFCSLMSIMKSAEIATHIYTGTTLSHPQHSLSNTIVSK
jgi:hypothetical protein